MDRQYWLLLVAVMALSAQDGCSRAVIKDHIDTVCKPAATNAVSPK